MENLVNLITQNGIGIICVAFLIYFINTTMKENSKAIQENTKTLQEIKHDNIKSLEEIKNTFILVMKGDKKDE